MCSAQHPFLYSVSNVHASLLWFCIKPQWHRKDLHRFFMEKTKTTKKNKKNRHLWKAFFKPTACWHRFTAVLFAHVSCPGICPGLIILVSLHPPAYVPAALPAWEMHNMRTEASLGQATMFQMPLFIYSVILCSTHIFVWRNESVSWTRLGKWLSELYEASRQIL